MPAHPRTLLRLLLTAALLVPSASARAAGGALPVGKGDVVKVDLSRVPSSRELRGTAICAASTSTRLPTVKRYAAPLTETRGR